MNKKPEIFKPNVGNINNNRKTYCSFLEDKLGVKVDRDRYEEPIDFINRLGRDGTYMFNKEVVIKTKDKIYNTRIAGKMGERIVTLDNDSININDIEKIYEK